MTAFCTTKEGGRMRATEIPADLVGRLRAAAGQDTDTDTPKSEG
jgi:hypothetical protein